MARPQPILAALGETRMLDKIRDRLVSRGYGLEVVASAAECVRRFQGDGSDLVILGLPLPDSKGADVVRALREIDPHVRVVVTGHDAQITGAGDAFGLGASEYVEDASQDVDELLTAIGSALGSRRGDVQLRYLKQREATQSSWASLVGTSNEMQEVVDVVKRVCERTTRGAPPTILVRGETGTGKGMLAKCVHYNGARRNQAFVELNCAAIPATLLESELFGVERGAYTDARTSRPGLFETAHMGTLFLDEIGTLSLDLQAKILTAIEEKRIRRVGGRQATQVDVQIITATHVDLAAKVKSGGFRADLYHRLNVVSVTMPPLRRRGQDKLLLARTFMDQMCREYGLPMRELTPEAEQYILEYAWPGNVRELRNQIERILLLGADDDIDVDHFDRSSLPPPSVPAPSSVRRPPPPPEPPKSFDLTLPDEGIGLEEVERELIKRALARFDGNVSRAARFLKVSRQTLIYRIKKHQL